MVETLGPGALPVPGETNIGGDNVAAVADRYGVANVRIMKTKIFIQTLKLGLEKTGTIRISSPFLKIAISLFLLFYLVI
ncbi:MAG: hypothetical protein HS132_03330 [Planctomycetia bacterium]|nr:hypothetical protein [Planctomycetia bacterium]